MKELEHKARITQKSTGATTGYEPVEIAEGWPEDTVVFLALATADRYSRGNRVRVSLTLRDIAEIQKVAAVAVARRYSEQDEVLRRYKKKLAAMSDR